MSQLLHRVPLGVLANVSQTKLVVPYYHVVSDIGNVCIKHLYRCKTTSEFRRDIDCLVKHYSPITLHDLIGALATERPFGKKVFCLTFDDGFREMYDVVAPILMEKGIPATFFINSAFVDNKELCYLHKASLLLEEFENRRAPELEQRLLRILEGSGARWGSVPSGILSVTYRERQILDEVADALQVDVQSYLAANEPYLTSGQITALISRGFTFGGHSIDHPLYARLPLEEQLEQTLVSVKYLRERFHLDYGAFAFPHHDRDVSREFFTRIAETGLVNISFGTAGLLLDSVPNHLQRFSLEKPLDTAERILAFQHWRKLRRMATMTATVTRH